MAQQNTRAADIALVDIVYLMQNAAAAKKVEALVEKMRADNQKAFDENTEAITRVYERISDRRALPSEAAYQQSFLEIQKKAQGYQKEVLERQDNLALAYLEALRKIADGVEAAGVGALRFQARISAHSQSFLFSSRNDL